MVLASEGFLFIHNIVPANYYHVAHGLIVLFILLVLSLLYRFSLKSVDKELVPSSKVNLKNIFQFAIEKLLGLMRNIIPHHAEDYFPIIGLKVLIRLIFLKYIFKMKNRNYCDNTLSRACVLASEGNINYPQSV